MVHLFQLLEEDQSQFVEVEPTEELISISITFIQFDLFHYQS